MPSLLEREASAYWGAAKRVRMNNMNQEEFDDTMDDLSLISQYSTNGTIRKDYRRLERALCASSA